MRRPWRAIAPRPPAGRRVHVVRRPEIPGFLFRWRRRCHSGCPPPLPRWPHELLRRQARPYSSTGYAWLAINFRPTDTDGSAERRNHGDWGVGLKDCRRRRLSALDWVDGTAPASSARATAGAAPSPTTRSGFGCAVARTRLRHPHLPTQGDREASGHGADMAHRRSTRAYAPDRRFTASRTCTRRSSSRELTCAS
jgi:hypothetical protein